MLCFIPRSMTSSNSVRNHEPSFILTLQLRDTRRYLNHGAGSSHVCSKCSRIPGLHENGSGSYCILYKRLKVEWKEKLPTSKFANQAFCRGHAGDETTGGYTLEFVITVPGYEVTIVDDVFLAGLDLILFVSYNHVCSVVINSRLSG